MSNLWEQPSAGEDAEEDKKIKRIRMTIYMVSIIMVLGILYIVTESFNFFTDLKWIR